VLDALQHARDVLEKEKDAELRELAKMELKSWHPNATIGFGNQGSIDAERPQ